ncbi:MAG: septum formation initiator family protein [Elusimicrobiaceae bacterium]|nr:septum formation initiator family protein [Elusimicrobiaceae bacterium]MBR3899524.1 septum formation initiator family protein [Elusimicrobiaceae bacterium]
MNQLIMRNKKLLLLCLAGVIAFVWFLGSSFRNLIHNKMEYKRLTKLSQQLDHEYQILEDRKARLEKQDPATMERLARVKYHMSGNSETEFRFKHK